MAAAVWCRGRHIGETWTPWFACNLDQRSWIRLPRIARVTATMQKFGLSSPGGFKIRKLEGWLLHLCPISDAAALSLPCDWTCRRFISLKWKANWKPLKCRVSYNMHLHSCTIVTLPSSFLFPVFYTPLLLLFESQSCKLVCRHGYLALVYMSTGWGSLQWWCLRLQAI